MASNNVAAAVDRAGNNLQILHQALLDPHTPLDGAVLLLKSISEDLSYGSYARWMSCEVEGYQDGPLDDLLGVQKGDPILDRITSYRQHKATVKIGMSGHVQEVPYRWFFTESVSKLVALAVRHATTPSNVILTIPAQVIPIEGIRSLVENSKEQQLPIHFPSATYPVVLEGLRAQLVAITSELSSAHIAQASMIA